MIKNKLDFKLINIALIVLMLFLLYQTGNMWLGLVNTLLKIILPFFFAFVIAYALYPIISTMQNKKMPKGISIFLVIFIFFGTIILLTSMIVPLLFNQLTNLFNGIISFIKTISIDYDLNLGGLQSALSTSFNDIISSFGKYVSDGTISIIGQSLNYISIFIITFASAIYFLIDMDKIRLSFKKLLLNKSKRLFRYFRILDGQMKSYLTAFLKISIISIFEYYFAYTIIGHPNALLLGFLAAIAGIIPYFGGMINNVVACITAFVISPNLFIKTIIVTLILSAVDANVINPIVYGKSNSVHPLIVIFSVFAGGILFGIIGIVISLPLAIIVISTYKFYKDDINDKIDEIKGDKKK